MVSTIDQWKNEFLESDVQVCALPVANNTSQLTSLELDVVKNAVGIRQNTYSTGRLCAKNALTLIDIEPQQYPDGLLRQEDGSVAWPVGGIGSISHTDDWAIAAATKSDGKYQSIGIDIEKIDRVEKDVLRLIATDNERDYLDRTQDLRWGRVALFSVKESLYKCLRPIFGEFIRFKDVELIDIATPLSISSGADLRDTSPAFYCPTVRLLHTELAGCCNEQLIEIRLAVLDKYVVSFVSYKRG